MSNGWTPERRVKQSIQIRNWCPWQKSTGPKTQEGKTRSAMRGYKGGIRKELRMLRKTLICLKKETLHYY